MRPFLPNHAWKLPYSRGELERTLAAFAEAAGRPGGFAELLLVGDKDMQALHASSLGRPGPTNILSFPLGAGANDSARQEGACLGCLVLSADTLRRECLLYGQNAEEHCIRLLAHGFAHLLGHEHGPDMEALCLRLEEAARSVLECEPISPASDSGGLFISTKTS